MQSNNEERHHSDRNGDSPGDDQIPQYIGRLFLMCRVRRDGTPCEELGSSPFDSAGITCESLDRSKCAYAVSSSGTRCVLEKRLRRSGHEEYTCQSSEIEAGGQSDWIESDECVEACGADRDTVGISSDFLWDTGFTQKLCSDRCSKNCTNIVDLYFKLAAEEGVFLPKLCGGQETSAQKSTVQIGRSGVVLSASGR